jgi:hypothetical protein
MVSSAALNVASAGVHALSPCCRRHAGAIADLVVASTAISFEEDLPAHR